MSNTTWEMECVGIRTVWMIILTISFVLYRSTQFITQCIIVSVYFFAVMAVCLHYLVMIQLMSRWLVRSDKVVKLTPFSRCWSVGYYADVVCVIQGGHMSFKVL